MRNMEQELVRHQGKSAAYEGSVSSMVDAMKENLRSAAVSRVYGSRTRALAWNDVANHPNNKIDLELPSPTPTSHESIDHDMWVRRLYTLSPEHLKNDYQHAASYLQEYFADQTSCSPLYVIDTHSNHFLDGMAPDISVQRNSSHHDKFNLAVAVDLKTGSFGRSDSRG